MSANKYSGRDDVIWVSDEGQVTTWTNLRGESVYSLAPYWKSAGVTHLGVGTGVTSAAQVSFGNIKGHKEWTTYPNYDGVGNDYVVIFDSTKEPYFSINIWFNDGIGGGTRQKGDADRYCDMRGTGSGKRVHLSFEQEMLTSCKMTMSGWRKMELLRYMGITRIHLGGYNTV